MAWPSIDAAPYVPDAKMTTNTSPEYTTREQILNSSKPNWDILIDEDKEYICSEVYFWDNDPVHKLASELKENLRDTEWNRTPNFQKLAELGLLFPQPTFKVMFGSNRGTIKDEESLKLWCQLLTHKWAKFLGIDLGVFIVCEEILQLREKYQQEITKVIKKKIYEEDELSLLAKILQEEPGLEKIRPQSSAIPSLVSADPIKFLKWIIYHIFHQEHTPINDYHDDSYWMLERVIELWWAEKTQPDSTKTLGEILTEKGLKYLSAYKKLRWIK